MKSKKINYLLGFLVLIIWGAIIYRIVAAAGGDQDPLPSSPVRVRETADEHSLPKDTAHLHTRYRDPFGQSKQPDTAMIPVKRLLSSASQTTAGPVTRPDINWSMISYRGYIRNAGSRKLIAILLLNGKEVMLAEGESSGQVKLLKNLRDSIRIDYQGHHKFIPLSTATL